MTQAYRPLLQPRAKHSWQHAFAAAGRSPWRVSHGLVLALVVISAVATRLNAPRVEFEVAPPQTGAYADEAPLTVPTPAPAPVPFPNAEVFREALLPPVASGTPAAHAGEMLARPTRIETYKVEAGDSLVGIAARAGISLQSLLWANDLENPDFLRIGQEIVVPPVTGVVHTIGEGETLVSISERYNAKLEDIVRWESNGIDNADVVVVGNRIMVPGGVFRPAPSAIVAAPSAPAPEPTPAPERFVATGRLQWPTTGVITTRFGQASFGSAHRGLDVAAPFGTPIYAADAGRIVTLLRWTNSFGWHIVIDHSNGMTTLYAHLSSFAVEHGQRVEKGQLIGRVGSTGFSTGPHLHFEVAQNGQLRDPLAYLR